jgi:hypothetical protein
LGPSGVRLEGPGASPPRHRIGIYGDRGGPVAAVTVSESARRLFIETNGEVTRTNVLGPLEQVANGYLARGVLLPTGPRPEPGTPLPATSDPEITARREGAGAAIEFAGGAAAAVAGRQIHVECTRRTIGHTFTPAERYSWSGRSPRAGRPLRLPVPSAYHLCGVAFSGRLARVALDDTGRVELEEGTVAIALTRVLRAAGAAAGRGYPTAQAIADRLGGAVAVLGVSTDEPPDLRIGAWSDGARRLVLSAIARTGRRMFIQIDGDIVTANDIDLPILPDP